MEPYHRIGEAIMVGAYLDEAVKAPSYEFLSNFI